MNSIPMLALPRTAILCLFVAFLVSTTGCVVAPVYVEKGVEERSDPSLVVLELGKKDGSVLVEMLDSKPLPNPFTTWNGGYAAVRELRIKPGYHTLEGVAGANGLSRYFTLSQTFEAGMRYRITTHQNGYSLDVSIEPLEPKEQAQ
jgi:hypothetical protein